MGGVIIEAKPEVQLIIKEDGPKIRTRTPQKNEVVVGQPFQELDGFGNLVDRERRHGASNYGMWDRLWVGILDLAGVWWLVRRRKRVPQVSEVSGDAR